MAKNVKGKGSESIIVKEVKKRRREWLVVVGLSLLFLFLTWVQYKLFDISQSLPFVHSVFFFGLVNFNIILFLLLIFLIFRNVVKVFAERETAIGTTLKGKLIAAFVAFSFIPTGLMFLVSVFYINNSFDKWFSEKMAGVLKSSIEITNAYYLTAKKKNYHFANEIAAEIGRLKRSEVKSRLESLRDRYSLDSVEYYPALFGQRILVLAKDDAIPTVPPVSLEFLKKGISQKVEDGIIHHFGEGNLVRVIVPLPGPKLKGALVVSSFVPLSLISRMDDIASAYEDFRDVNPLEYPLKSIYLIILSLMTLVILLGATWFGFYLARQLSIPLEELGLATKRVLKGNYARVNMVSGSQEMNQLIANFNAMNEGLESSQREVREANQNLRQTLTRLDEHSRYIEVVLSNITTGVISVDQTGVITMINRHAERLLELEASKYIGLKLSAVLPSLYYREFTDLTEAMRKHKAESIEKEIRVQANGREIPLQMNLSVLYDEKKKELGKVLVFDDLTPVLSAQRALAWSEVARRIAHEIKNPLTPIKLAAERLQKKFALIHSDPAFMECTSMIIDQVDDLKNLVNEFSNFARMPKANPVLADLNKVIEDGLKLFREAHPDCTMTFQPDPKLPSFYFDPDQMRRVLTNLLDNALAALPKTGGKIEIKTQFDAQLRMVQFTVADHGIGIPAALRSRIFEPYVTTKANGTGLGLAIVKRTIDDHQGFIRAVPNNPSGTRFVVELPVSEG